MADRAYGYRHQQRRRWWKRELFRVGAVQCGCAGQCRVHRGRCSVVITPETPWHLGHTTPVRRGGTGEDATPWCIECNLRDAAAATNRRPALSSREWG